MPRLRFLVTVYECPLCGVRVRAEVGKTTLKCGRHREWEEPEPRPIEMMQTIIGPRPIPDHRRAHLVGPEPTLIDIGPVKDRSLEPVLRQIWMADAA
jgi:hypothetical protein